MMAMAAEPGGEGGRAGRAARAPAPWNSIRNLCGGGGTEIRIKRKGTSRYVITAPTKRPRTLRFCSPPSSPSRTGRPGRPSPRYYISGRADVVRLDLAAARAAVLSSFLHRYLDFREGAGETELTLSGSTKSGPRPSSAFRRRPVLRAAREGFGFGAGAGGGGGICGMARSSSSRSKESKRKPSPSINGWVASSI